MKIPGGKKRNMKRVLWVTDSSHDPLDQGYTTKLKNLPVKPGRLYEVRVSHDDWCPLLKGGPCRCNPDIEQVDITPDA